MASVAERAFDSVFPTADELWENGGAKVAGDVPYFMDLDIDGEPETYATKNLYVKDGLRRRKIGSSILLGYTMSDGIDRLVKVRTLDDNYRSDAEMLTTTSTAWTTTIGGYVGRRDERIARETGIQTVSIGAEGSTNARLHEPGVMRTVSLAKAAQSEQAILEDVSRRFDLPTRHYGLGDSRGAMIKPAHSLYAPLYGNEVLFTDIKAPCVPDKLGPEDMPRVALWMAIEALGAAAVTATLLKERDFGLLVGTFDTHPRSLPVSLAGIMPALMSGEAGRLAEQAPRDMAGHLVLYGHDILSSVERWHEIYEPKPNMAIKNVSRGSHAHLLSRIGLQVDRIKRAESSLRTDGAIDADYVIRGHKSDYEKQAGLRLVVNQ